MKKKIPKNTRLTKKRISSFIFQKFLPTREVFFGNNYKIYNLSSKRSKNKKSKKKEQKIANFSQKEKQIFQFSENNSNKIDKIELDYLNFSQMDIDIYRNNRSFEDDIFSSTLKLDSDKRKIAFLRYENENKNYFSHLNGNEYNEELQLSTKIIKKDEEETNKTSSTICNYYNKSQVTPIQKGEEKNSKNKIEEIQNIINNHIPNINNNNNNNAPKEKKDFRKNKNIKDIFIVGFKNNEIVDKIRSSTFENEEININKNNNNKNVKPKISKKQNKNNKKKNNNYEIKLNIPFKNNLINDYMRNKIKIHNYKNRFGAKYIKNNKKEFLKEKLIPSNKINLTSVNNNTCHKTEENNNSIYKKRNFSLLINEAKILKINKSRHKNNGAKNDNSNSKKYLLSKIDSMIKENNNMKKNKNVINNIKKKSLNNFSFKNFRLQSQINTLDINNNKRKISKNKKIHENNSLNLHSFNNLKNTLIKTLTKTNLPIIIKKNNIKKKSNSKSSKNKTEQMSIVPYRLKSKRKNSVGSSLINKIYTKKNKTNFKNTNYILKKSVLPRKKFSFSKMQITPRSKLVERIKGLNSMNIGKKLFVDLSQKNEIVAKECNTENKKKFIKKSNSIKNPMIRTDWKKNKYNKNNNNNSSNLKKYKLFNTLNEWKINNEINPNAKQKTDVGEPSEMGPNNYLNKMNLISSDESDKENEL